MQVFDTRVTWFQMNVTAVLRDWGISRNVIIQVHIYMPPEVVILPDE